MRFLSTTFPNSPAHPPILFDQSLNASSVKLLANDNKNALFCFDNNVTPIVRYFSVISTPLDQGPHEIQSQLLPKFVTIFLVVNSFMSFC